MTASEKLKGYFREEQSFWKMAALVLGCFALLKALRLPGSWALTQIQVDYSQGFLKRGLLGTVLGHVGLQHYAPLCAVLLLMLFVFFAVLLMLTRRSGLLATPAVAALFASSYVVTYLTHLVGYLEIVNGTLAMLLLLIRNTRTRFLLGLPVIAAASLIHESFLLLFAPIVLLTFVLDGATAKDAQSRKRAWMYGVVLAVCAAGFAFATSLTPTLSAEKVTALQSTIAARADYPVRADFFPLMNKSLGENMRNMAGLLHNNLWREWQVLSLFVLLPVLVPVVRFSRRLIREGGLSQTMERTVRIAAMVSAFAPLLMHLLGWDALRWNVLCTLSAFLTLVVLRMYLPQARLVLRAAEKNLIILLIAVNMACGWGLFEGAMVNPYPFFPKALNARWIATHPGVPFSGL